jgi:hypothetical protein
MCKYTAIVHGFPFWVQIRVEKGGGFREGMETRLADGIHRETRRSEKGREGIASKEGDDSPCQRGK